MKSELMQYIESIVASLDGVRAECGDRNECLEEYKRVVEGAVDGINERLYPLKLDFRGIRASEQFIELVYVLSLRGAELAKVSVFGMLAGQEKVRIVTATLVRWLD